MLCGLSMTSRWPTLARLALCLLGLTSLAPGCFLLHGEDDPAPIVSPPRDSGAVADGGVGDAGSLSADGGSVCELLPGTIDGLTCPGFVTAGEEVVVSVRHSAGLCCGSDAGELTVQVIPDNHFLVSSSWRACDCCLACGCDPPPLEAELELGVLDPGRYVVEAGDQRCDIDVVEVPACFAATIDEVRVPRVVFTDQELPMTLVTDSAGGCGCAPTMTTDGPLRHGMEVCGCCLECDCIDFGYEGSVILPTPALGIHELMIDGDTYDVSVHEPSSCRAHHADSVRVVGPEPTHDTTGPRLWWAAIATTESVCCAVPEIGVRQPRITSDGGIELEVLTCTLPDPCPCVPPGPTAIEVWHSLGELTSGHYRLSVGDNHVAFDVP